jgi:hypothetical protein
MAISRGKPTTQNNDDLAIIKETSRNGAYLGSYFSQLTEEEEESHSILQSFSQCQKSRSKNR